MLVHFLARNPLKKLLIVLEANDLVLVEELRVLRSTKPRDSRVTRCNEILGLLRTNTIDTLECFEGRCGVSHLRADIQMAICKDLGDLDADLLAEAIALLTCRKILTS